MKKETTSEWLTREGDTNSLAIRFNFESRSSNFLVSRLKCWDAATFSVSVLPFHATQNYSDVLGVSDLEKGFISTSRMTPLFTSRMTPPCCICKICIWCPHYILTWPICGIYFCIGTGNRFIILLRQMHYLCTKIGTGSFNLTWGVP